MGLVILIMVVTVAVISLAISCCSIALCRSALTKVEVKGALLGPILILSPVLWGLIYWFPVNLDYGAGANINWGLVILVCSMKTALFILAPAIVTVPITISIVSKKNRSE